MSPFKRLRPQRRPKTVRRQLGRRRNRRRRGRGRRSGPRSIVLVEAVVCSIELGKSINFKISDIQSRPKNRNMRLVSIVFTCTEAVTTTKIDGVPVGTRVPSAVQLELNNDAGDFVTNTGPRVLGPLPTVTRTHLPRSEDWMAYNTVESQVLGRISAICLNKNSEFATAIPAVRGVAHIHMRYGPEVVGAACPVQYKDTSDVFEDHFDMVDLNLNSN